MKTLKILLLVLLYSCSSQIQKPYMVGNDNYPFIVEKVKWNQCDQRYMYYMKNLEFPMYLPHSFMVGDTLDIGIKSK